MSSRNQMRLAALSFACLALAGCVTVQYAPIGAEGSPYGYSDRQNPDGSHTVLVVATSPAQAHEYWDRRATEICGHSNFRKNIFRAEIPVVTTTGYASNPYNPAYGGSYTQDAYGNLIMEGYLHCDAEGAAAPSTQSDATTTPAASGQAQ